MKNLFQKLSDRAFVNKLVSVLFRDYCCEETVATGQFEVIEQNSEMIVLKPVGFFCCMKCGYAPKTVIVGNT